MISVSPLAQIYQRFSSLKSQLMPTLVYSGAAWRVKITPPVDSKLGTLPAVGKNASSVTNNRRLPKSAILQAALYEAKSHKHQGTQLSASIDDEKPRVRITLWKRELLVGSMELDPSMKVKHADQNAGLIMGRPVSVLLKQSLSKFLDIPRKASWDQVMGNKAKRGSLKTAPTVGKISAVRAFPGNHPDGGSMRILLQGVVITDAMNGKSRIVVTIKPDLQFAAAHSDIWGALGLNCFDEDVKEKAGSQGSSKVSSRSTSSNGGVEGAQAASPFMKLKLEGLADDGEAPNKEGSEFIKRWVQTMDANRPSPKIKEDRIEDVSPDYNIEEEGEKIMVGKNDWMKIAETMPDEAMDMPPSKVSKSHHQKHHDGTHNKRDDDGFNNDAASSDAGSETESKVSEEQRSTFSSAVADPHADEVRRGERWKLLDMLVI